MTGVGRAVRRGWRAVTVGVAVLFALLTAAVPAGAASISNPPALAGHSFTLRLKGASGTVSVYLSSQRTLGKGAVALGRARVSHGRVRVKVKPNIRPGGYYVLACTHKLRTSHCVSSRRATAVLPKLPATPPLGVNGTAVAATRSAFTGTLGSAGGSLSVTGSDGTKYTLAFDAKSVPDGTQITLTPLSGLSGGGIGRFIAGVEISAPSGVVPAFSRGGILVIRPAHAVPVAGRTGLAFTGSGQGIHTIPLAPQVKPITLPVWEPGGYALASGGARPNLRAPFASDPAPGFARFYIGLLGGLANVFRTSGYTFGDSSDQEKAWDSAVKSVLDEWYREILKHEVHDGLQDDDAAQTAITDLIAWGDSGGLMLGDGEGGAGGIMGYSNRLNGMSDYYGPNWEKQKVFSRIQRMAVAAYNRNQQQCRENDDLSKMDIALSWYRAALRADHPDSVSFQDLFACAHFQLDFDSTIVHSVSGSQGDASYSGSWTNEYTAAVTIASDDLGRLVGSSTGDYAQNTGTETVTAPCNGGTLTTDSTDQRGSADTFTVVSLTLPHKPGQSPVLTLNVGQPYETLETTISGCGEPNTSTDQIAEWLSGWQLGHSSQAVKGAYAIPLNLGGGSTYATKSFSGQVASMPPATFNENTTITLLHTPQPFTPLS